MPFVLDTTLINLGSASCSDHSRPSGESWENDWDGLVDYDCGKGEKNNTCHKHKICCNFCDNDDDDDDSDDDDSNDHDDDDDNDKNKMQEINHAVIRERKRRSSPNKKRLKKSALKCAIKFFREFISFPRCSCGRYLNVLI